MKWGWWLLLLLGLWWWMRQPRRSGGAAESVLPQSRHAQPPRPREQASPLRRQADGAASSMVVPCEHCGVHVPWAEAIESPVGDEHFCCEAHRIAWLERHTAAR